MNLTVLTTSQVSEWMRVLEQSYRYDFYHLAQYHALAEEQDEGTAFLFHYSDGPYSIALPLLLRPIHDSPSGLSKWQDATSVYGYAGPVASHADIPGPVVQNFQALLQSQLQQMNVVTVFSRLHPLLPQEDLIRGLGDSRMLRQTVSIDLTLPPVTQRALFRKCHKEGVNKLRRQNFTCIEDHDGVHLEAFINIYYETMRRVHAAPNYFFPVSYFHHLAEALGERLHLFVCLSQETVVCGGLFVECCGILQYHLGGTSDDTLRFSPMKLLVDETRRWANGRNLQCYHLGGGATASADDSLLHFKRGFSETTHNFNVWTWVLLEDVYARLCEERLCSMNQNHLVSADSDFFPEYRTPTLPDTEIASQPTGVVG